MTIDTETEDSNESIEVEILDDDEHIKVLDESVHRERDESHESLEDFDDRAWMN